MKTFKIDRISVLEILLVALMINYMVVTIILKDFFLFKYLRDILLLILIAGVIKTWHIKKIDSIWLLGIYVLCVCMAIPRATSLNTGITATRRYLFPVLVYYISYNLANKKTIERVTKFILPFFAFLSVFGIFQAYILKDEFLKNLGYPQVFLPAYGRDMLNQAYYFGDFGVQRVVATMSSPNILALIFGCTGIFLIVNRDYLLGIKHWKIYSVLVAIGYILTVSRSNFVALGVVGLTLIFPKLKHKERWIIGATIAALAVIVLGYVQGPTGMVHKLYNWGYKSLTFKESSAAGRSVRWISALTYVIRNPLGLGPGYVGSVASNAGKQALYFDCENSYLCLALDAGWMACISYYLFYVITALKCRKKSIKYRKNDNELHLLNASAVAMIIYFMVVMFFSNHVQDMEPTSFLFMFLGFVQGYTARRKLELCL